MGILELFQELKTTFFTKEKVKKKEHKVVDNYRLASKYYHKLLLEKINNASSSGELRDAREQVRRVKDSDLFDILVERGAHNYSDLCTFSWEAFLETERKFFEEGKFSKKALFCDGNFVLERAEITKDGIKYDNNICLPISAPFFEKNRLKEGNKFLLLPKDSRQRANDLIKVKKEVASHSLPSGVVPFRDIITKAASMGASDVHFTFTSKYFYTLFRIDGVLSHQKEYTIGEDAGKDFVRSVKGIAIDKSKGSVRADSLNTIDDGKILYDDLGLDIRLEVIPEGTYSGRNAITCRLLEKSRGANSRKLSNFGYGEDIIKAVEDIRFLKSGLVIVVGETGTGKSTFCEMMLDYIPPTMRVVSMQDPIERTWEKKNATQFQLNFETSPLVLIKGFKRMDPDVIYLGEVRNDPEVISALVEGSRAGQLNVSTIHLPSIFSFYAGFKEVFGVSYITSIDLTHFLAGQVLVRKLCDSCKIDDEREINKKELREAMEEGNISSGFTKPLKDYLESKETSGYLRNEKGCEKCQKRGIENYGYSGRIPIYEFMRVSPDVKRWLRTKLVRETEGTDAYEFEKWACENNYATNKLSIFIQRLKEGLVAVDDGAKREVLYG